MEVVGLSQAELARRVGLSQPSIFNLIHRGKKGSTKLHVIARELRTTPAYLMGETDDPISELPDDALSADEQELIEHFRRLTTRDRAAARQLIRSLAEHNDTITPTPAPTPATLHSPQRKYAGSR